MWKWSELKNLLKKEKSGGWDLKDLGAIMLPVIYPAYKEDIYNPTDPHITMVQFLDINNPENGYTKEDIFEVIENTGEIGFQLQVPVTGVEYFGENNDWPVLRVEHQFLHKFNANLKAALGARGIIYDTRFPEFKPHVSTTAEAARDGVYPANFWTRPVEVWWGDKHYKFDRDSRIWTV